MKVQNLKDKGRFVVWSSRGTSIFGWIHSVGLVSRLFMYFQTYTANTYTTEEIKTNPPPLPVPFRNLRLNGISHVESFQFGLGEKIVVFSLTKKDNRNKMTFLHPTEVLLEQKFRSYTVKISGEEN